MTERRRNARESSPAPTRIRQPTPVLPGDAVDFIVPLDPGRVLKPRARVRLLAAVAPTPGEAPGPLHTLPVTALALAPQVAVLVRVVFPVAARLDISGMQTGIRTHELPPDSLDALIPATAHAIIDADGRLARCSPESADAGGLARGAALAKVPRDSRGELSARLSGPVLDHLHPGLSHAQATEAWAQRPQRNPQPPARRLCLSPGDSLGIAVDADTGRARLGPVSGQEIDTRCTVALLRPTSATSADNARITVPVADTLTVELSILASLLHAPAVLALLSRWRRAPLAPHPHRVRETLHALQPLLGALAVGAVSSHPPAPRRGHVP